MTPRLKPDEFETEVTCNMCKTTKVIVVPKDGYKRWISGECIQNAMPSVKAEDRELLISGICGKCFDSLFEE